jgi:hypothetical protein
MCRVLLNSVAPLLIETRAFWYCTSYVSRYYHSGQLVMHLTTAFYYLLHNVGTYVWQCFGQTLGPTPIQK